MRLRSVCATSLAVIGCSASPGAVVRQDSAGVQIIVNHGADRPLSWRFDTAAVIRGDVASVEMTELTEYTVDADTLGHTYVMDAWFGQRAQMLDTLGRLLRVLTRRGRGPGEVAAGASLSASPDGVVSVLDFGHFGLVRVASDGTVRPPLPLAGYQLFGGGRAVADTVVVHTLASDGSSAEWLQYRTATSRGIVVVHTPERLGPLSFCGSPTEGLTPMLSPELRWTSRGSQIAVAHTGDYRVDLFRGSDRLQSIRRSGQVERGTAEAVRRFFPDGKLIGSKYCTVSPSELASKRGVAVTIQPVRRLSIDLDGNTWVERNTFPDQVGRTDVFDSTGAYLGTVSGLGAPLGFPSRRHLVVASSDSTVEPRLYILRRIR